MAVAAGGDGRPIEHGKAGHSAPARETNFCRQHTRNESETRPVNTYRQHRCVTRLDLRQIRIGSAAVDRSTMGVQECPQLAERPRLFGG